MPGRWEFPGGKCEPLESPDRGAVRECEEETGLRVRVVSIRRVITHQYAHGLVELHYFDCETIEPHAKPHVESGFSWIPAEDLPTLDFPEANGPVLEELARGVPPVARAR
jgi:8-oxo-dGTP diphosphatase